MKIKIHFAVEPGAVAAATAERVATELLALADVDAATAVPEPTRMTGLEILADVALVAQIAHQARDIATDAKEVAAVLRGFFAQIAAMVKRTPGVREATVDVGLKAVPVSALGDADIQRIADEIVARLVRPA